MAGLNAASLRSFAKEASSASARTPQQSHVVHIRAGSKVDNQVSLNVRWENGWPSHTDRHIPSSGAYILNVILQTPNLKEKAASFLKNASLAVAAGAAALSLQVGQIGAPVDAATLPNPAIPDLGVLITGKPINDAKALLRYALPIDNKDIQTVQMSLEAISDDLRVPGLKALDGVEKVS